uniref:Translation initiation factor IF-2, chloroplastic n=1 Tax=Bangiopsis subsimplex TaxID=139980 RepID=A0A1C9CD19_9RHOD|nr:translation initiation factor 2 [Bangiopsis subsimplex]AOM66244.1 translation initiation factor 2 [Bangiopsis subsimplex]ARO90394.1 initiation factor IF2 [Bangiopsis subsimplex]
MEVSLYMNETLKVKNSKIITKKKNKMEKILYKTELLLLNKIKKRKNILELSNPKLIRDIKSVISTDTFINTNKVDVNNSEKTVKQKEEKVVPYVDQESKSLKTKNKKKNKNYIQFEDPEEKVTTKKSSILINFDDSDSTKSLKKGSTNKKSKIRSSNNANINIQEIDKSLESPQEIIVTGPMGIKEVAQKINKSEIELIKFLFLKGIAVTINEIIDVSMIKMIAENFQIEVLSELKDTKQRLTNLESSEPLEDNFLDKRAPIVAVLGHVDHGKTSVLDNIRGVKTAKEEAGGITQGLNAYNVIIKHKEKDEKIVFLDTPGHAAFTQMRSRGALIMDIAILVVAADDSIQPQTIEAIEYIKSTKVPLIVAINKIDKDTSNPEKIKEELSKYDIIPEEWGGDTIFVSISALKNINIDSLVDSIFLVAELQNLQASSKAQGSGIIIEAQLDKNKGPAVTILVQNGTFKRGDIIGTEDIVGKIKIISNEANNFLESAGPSQIINLWGFTDLPEVGKLIRVYKTDKEAKNQIKTSLNKNIISTHLNVSDYSLQKNIKVLNLIIKSNNKGSLEAILQMIKEIPQQKVAVKVLSAAPGEITETDILFASTTEAIVMGFDTTLAPGAKSTASRLNIQIYESQVIYDLIDKLEKEMCKLLAPEFIKEEIGLAKVKNIFSLTKGQVAGCYIESGKLLHNSVIQIIRKNNVIYEGNLDSLKRVKEDIKEISAGNECGVLIKDFQDWQQDDIIKDFKLTLKEPSLSS